jgi:hypothetical protein
MYPNSRFSIIEGVTNESAIFKIIFPEQAPKKRAVFQMTSSGSLSIRFLSSELNWIQYIFAVYSSKTDPRSVIFYTKLLNILYGSPYFQRDAQFGNESPFRYSQESSETSLLFHLYSCLSSTPVASITLAECGRFSPVFIISMACLIQGIIRNDMMLPISTAD